MPLSPNERRKRRLLNRDNANEKQRKYRRLHQDDTNERQRKYRCLRQQQRVAKYALDQEAEFTLAAR
ncbi:hypothetical protein ACHAXM_000112 [Skeletonema potamos]|jgi:hypothetical protein